MTDTAALLQRQLEEDVDDLKSQIAYSREALDAGLDIEMHTKLLRVNQDLLARAEANLGRLWLAQYEALKSREQE